MKKKLLSLLLILALLLCGCGKQDAAGSPTNATQPSTESLPAETAAPTTEPAPAETALPTAAPTEAPTAPADTEATVSLGILEGGTYTNAYAGFGFTVDENWVVYPADQLQELPENISAMFEGTEFESHEINTITDVLAENVTDLTTMNVLYQKVSMQERLTYLTMDEKDILDMMTEEYYDTMVASYANAGITVESMTTKTVTFLGRDRTALYTVSTVQDVPYYILQLYDFHLGQYSVTTTVASYVEDNTEGLLDLFFAVE